MASTIHSTVLITGATGFIAQHIVDKLLARGYKVIGTARSKERYSPILSLFKEKYRNGELSFEIVPDISSDNAFDHVLLKHPEIMYVIHTASPFSFGLKKSLKESYLDPAVNGTLNILNATKKFAPQVRNVVITSSFAAVKLDGEDYKTVVHTNATWNPIKWGDVTDEGLAYSASKKCAEEAARDFMTKENPNFKLATVNPPLVLGPQVFDDSVKETLNTSNQFLIYVTKIDKTLTTPQTQFNFLAVDVRDVAEFHILPLENSKLASERQFIASAPFIAQLGLDILNKDFPELCGKIARGDPSSTEKIIKEFCPKFDISNIVEAADNYKFIGVEESIVDVFKQYLAKFSI